MFAVEIDGRRRETTGCGVTSTHGGGGMLENDNECGGDFKVGSRRDAIPVDIRGRMGFTASALTTEAVSRAKPDDVDETGEVKDIEARLVA